MKIYRDKLYFSTLNFQFDINFPLSNRKHTKYPQSYNSISILLAVLLVLSLREQNNHLINIVDYDKTLSSVFSLLQSCEWD